MDIEDLSMLPVQATAPLQTVQRGRDAPSCPALWWQALQQMALCASGGWPDVQKRVAYISVQLLRWMGKQGPAFVTDRPSPAKHWQSIGFG